MDGSPIIEAVRQVDGKPWLRPAPLFAKGNQLGKGRPKGARNKQPARAVEAAYRLRRNAPGLYLALISPRWSNSAGWRRLRDKFLAHYAPSLDAARLTELRLVERILPLIMPVGGGQADSYTCAYCRRRLDGIDLVPVELSAIGVTGWCHSSCAPLLSAIRFRLARERLNQILAEPQKK